MVEPVVKVRKLRVVRRPESTELAVAEPRSRFAHIIQSPRVDRFVGEGSKGHIEFEPNKKYIKFKDPETGDWYFLNHPSGPKDPLTFSLSRKEAREESIDKLIRYTKESGDFTDEEKTSTEYILTKLKEERKKSAISYEGLMKEHVFTRAHVRSNPGLDGLAPLTVLGKYFKITDVPVTPEDVHEVHAALIKALRHEGAQFDKAGFVVPGSIRVTERGQVTPLYADYIVKDPPRVEKGLTSMVNSFIAHLKNIKGEKPAARLLTEYNF